MKHFLTRTCAKIGRFFWSWGFLKFVLWTATLIVFFYVEEDWRGARAWAATKAEWEAKGETFDYNQLIPRPIPDDENLAAISLFKLEPNPEDKNNTTFLLPVTLSKALRSNLPGGNIPTWSGWQKGEKPDFEKIRADIAVEYAKAFGALPSNSDSLSQFEALYPFIAELHTASGARPYCRFAEDYAFQPAYGGSFALITSQIKVAKILEMHAILALNENQPKTALVDIETIAKINSGVSREPILISGLVASALTTMNSSAISYGLAIHAWNDVQLAEMQATLAALDPLANYQLVMRGELIGFSLPIMDYFKKQRPNIRNFFSKKDHAPLLYATNPIFLVWPKGWLDLNSSRMTDALLGSVSLVDPKIHRVFVDRADQTEDEACRFADHWGAYAPWNILYATAAPAVLKALIQFAHAQTWVDEARIACALERYRLTHGAYPDSLDALAPESISTVPRDPINGQAYHYHVRPDDSFMLYSVGWNQEDDGGIGVFVLNNSTDPNDSPQKHGDWVWPTPSIAPAKVTGKN